MKSILNKRLQELSVFIEAKDKVIDIGCDHGLLGIYLVKEKNVSKMISSDINEKPLEKAHENVLKYHLEKMIAIKKGNGLEAIDEDIDTVVISGMGGINMMDILKDIHKYPNVKKVVLSPNSDWKLTRCKMHQLGFKIVKEKLVHEHGKDYLISLYQKGMEKEDYFFGKLALNEIEVKNYYLKRLQKNQIILDKIPWYHVFRRKKLQKENKWIKRKI